MGRTVFRRASILAVILGAVFLLAPRDAGAWRFGTQQDTHVIGAVKLKGPNDTPLVLGYMTRTEFFLAGLYVKDEGYVLIPQGPGMYGRYMQMPDAETLARHQKAGMLPSPLPRYKLGFWTYVIGYSFWIMIAFFAVCGWWSRSNKQRDATDAAAFGDLNRLPGAPTRLPGAAP